MRKYLDDLFVIDAPSVFIDRNLGGKVRAAQILDGATIFPLIDDVGRRPDTEYRLDENGLVYEHRQPAFQQIIYGLPMINLSEDELIYGMMRPRPEMPVFGFSPVEQILTEATEAIRKTFYQLEFWRSGSIPELLVTVPDTWSPRQIATYQGHFDALLSGQLSLKSKVRFIPGGMKPFDIKNASGESLWSQRDELLIRLCCYAFSVSPTPFVHQMNRATANQSQEASEEEGLFPVMSYWKDDVMDTIIQEKFGYDDVEFSFLPRPEADQSKQATIHQIQLHDGMRTINEVRAEQGYEPIPDGDYPLIYTGNTVVRLDQVISGETLMAGQGGNSVAASDPKPVPQGKETTVPIRGGARPATASPLPPKPTPVHKAVTAKQVRQAAKQAERDPSSIKRKVGNYPKGHLWLHGLSLSIENEKGSLRGEKDRAGVDHYVKMPAPYGYIRGTIGADGMQVDCYIGRHPESKIVWVIDQDRFDVNGEDKGFDEHKVMLGYSNPNKAIKDYMKSHYDGFGHERLSAITAVTYSELKKWLKTGNMKAPISEQGVGQVIGRRGKGNGITKSDTISQSTGLLNYDQLSLAPSRERRHGKKKRKGLRSGPRWLSLAV